MKKILLPILLLFFTLCLCAQQDSIVYIKLIEKENIERKEEQGIRCYGDTLLKLYPNCLYDITIKNGKRYNGRLIKIEGDSLWLSNYFNEAVAEYAGDKLDTNAVYYKNLDNMTVVEILGSSWHQEYDFADYDFFFIKDTIPERLKPKWVRIFEDDTTLYELVPKHFANVMEYYFEYKGRVTYNSRWEIQTARLSDYDMTYDTKYGLWYTPNSVEKINGIAIGLYPGNIKNSGPKFDLRDSLTINGLNLDLSPLGFLAFLGMSYQPEIDLDYYEKYMEDEVDTWINGISLSLTLMANNAEIRGVNVCGFLTWMDRVDGVSISPFNKIFIMNGICIGGANNIYSCNGVQIGVVGNMCERFRGLQIGFFNEATDFKGIQLGLWNKIDGKGLPIINMRF